MSARLPKGWEVNNWVTKPLFRDKRSGKLVRSHEKHTFAICAESLLLVANSNTNTRRSNSQLVDVAGMMLGGAAMTVAPALMVPAAAALAIFGGKGKNKGGRYIPSAAEVCEAMHIDPSQSLLCSSSDVTVSAPVKRRGVLTLGEQPPYKIAVIGAMTNMGEYDKDCEYSIEMKTNISQKEVVSWFADAGFDFKLL